MPELADLFRELVAAERAHYRPNVVHVRVTESAPQGQVFLVPMHPDRARAGGHVKLHAFPDGGVDVFADVSSPDWPREVLIHPEDFAAIRVAPDPGFAFDPGRSAALFGIPVVRDA